MERLLHWAVENSDQQGLEESRNNVKNLDPEIIDMILGKDDPTRMKECIIIIRDKSGKYSEDERLAAFDELEMIVEGIDNASNMEKMNLWPEIFACTCAEEPLKVVRFALWIIGTCAQNNPEAQKALLEKHGVFEKLLALWIANPAVQAKIMYCLSALLSNNPAGLEDFVTRDGFKIINDFSEEDESVKSKLRFLLKTILAHEIGPDAVRCLIQDCPRLLAILASGDDD